MLLMKREFFEAIRAGRKRSTLRWWRYARVRAGQCHAVPGLGRVRITRVRTVRLTGLTDGQARADGFADARSLRAALRRIYPGISSKNSADGRRLYLVHFELL